METRRSNTLIAVLRWRHDNPTTVFPTIIFIRSNIHYCSIEYRTCLCRRPIYQNVILSFEKTTELSADCGRWRTWNCWSREGTEQNFMQPFKTVLHMRWRSNKNNLCPTLNMFMKVLSNCQLFFVSCSFRGISETTFFLSPQISVKYAQFVAGRVVEPGQQEPQVSPRTKTKKNEADVVDED